MLRDAFFTSMIILIVNECSGLPAVLEVEERGLANEEVWEAILYGYVIDPDEPSYLSRGDRVFKVDSSESVAISSNSDMKMDVVYSDSEHTVAENLATSMKVGGSFGAFSAAASMEVSKSSDRSIKTVRLDRTTKSIVYEVASKGSFRTFPQRYLTDNFKEAVKALTVEQIEQRIGSFYATRLDLGGEIRKSYTMQALEEDTESSVKAELEASYGSDLLGVSAEASVGVSSRVSNKNAQMSVEWSAKGGDTTVWLGKEFTDSGDTSVSSIQSQWAGSMTDENLYPFNFELGLMWDLVKAVDQTKGDAFQRYLLDKWAGNIKAFLPSRFFEGDLKWRSDGRCGPNYPLWDGSKAECNGDGSGPCCSPGGWCGNSKWHCDCAGCIKYPPTPRERCGYIQHYGGNCVHPYHRYDPMAMPTPGAQLVLYPGCKNEQYYFCYTLDGELKHKRSGLCIESQLAGEEHRWNDIPLRLNTCGKDYQRFRLTPAGSIQHSNSGKCWHPYGGSSHPAPNTVIVLYPGCDQDRLRFMPHYQD